MNAKSRYEGGFYTYMLSHCAKTHLILNGISKCGWKRLMSVKKCNRYDCKWLRIKAVLAKRILELQ